LREKSVGTYTVSMGNSGTQAGWSPRDQRQIKRGLKAILARAS
jgi:hypothetical protein